MDETLREQGLRIRTDVLGEDYVRRAMTGRNEFNAPLQDLVNDFCWGAVWGRKELPRKTRSVINIALLSALNRPHEFKTHVAAALRNGVTREEIREILLQVTVYCGVPAGVDAFRNATEVFRELDSEERGAPAGAPAQTEGVSNE